MHNHLPDREQEQSWGGNKQREGSVPHVLVIAEVKEAQEFKISVCLIVREFQHES